MDNKVYPCDWSDENMLIKQKTKIKKQLFYLF